MKVRMVMAERGLDREIKTVASYAFEHCQPEYQALNPHSLVPTLVNEGRIIIQSSNIAEYLDDVFPDLPLQPEDPFAKSKMREWSLLHPNHDRAQGYLARVTSPVDTTRPADTVGLIAECKRHQDDPEYV